MTAKANVVPMKNEALRPTYRGPFAMFDELRTEFENLMQKPFWPTFTNRFREEKTTWTPPIDVFEKDHDLVVKCDLPGMKKGATPTSPWRRTISSSSASARRRRRPGRAFLPGRVQLRLLLPAAAAGLPGEPGEHHRQVHRRSPRGACPCRPRRRTRRFPFRCSSRACSGIYGQVMRLDEQSVQLQIADKVNIKVSKAAIGGYQGQPPVVETTTNTIEMHMSNLRWKVVTILAVFVVFFGLGVYPILASRYQLPAPGWLQEKQLKLGLDLKGGVHLVLRVETDDALRLVTEQEMERLRDELQDAQHPGHQHRRADPTHFKVDGVPPAQDAALPHGGRRGRRRTSIAASGLNGTYTFTMKPNIQRNLRERVGDPGAPDDRAPRQRARRHRAEHRAAGQGDQILVQLPGVTDVERAKEIIGSTGLLELKIVEAGPSPSKEDAAAVNGQVPQGMEIVPGAGRRGRPASPRRLLPGEARSRAVTGQDLRSARASARREQPAGGQLHAEAATAAASSAR